MRSAITISLVEEARGGPFVFWDDLAAGCAQAAEIGFNGIELFAPSAQAIDINTLKSLVDRHQLSVAGLGTGAGWVKHKLRLTDPDSSVRARAIQFVADLIELGSRFKAPVVIGSMQGRWGDGVTRDQALDWLQAALNELGERAASRGVPLLYEPLNRYETNLFSRVQDSLEFLTALRTRNVRLLCDLFHMNIEEQDMAAALRLAGPKLGHVHWADSNRRAMGFGHTDVRAIAGALREAAFQGFISAEILPLPDGATAARQTLKSLQDCGLIA